MYFFHSKISEIKKSIFYGLHARGIYFWMNKDFSVKSSIITTNFSLIKLAIVYITQMEDSHDIYWNKFNSLLISFHFRTFSSC